jgi:hypothetical protein
MIVRPNRSVLVVAGLALAAFASPAFAYLDPSTGSMIISAIVGILATLGLAIKTYWYKLKSFFRGSDSVQTNASAEGQSESNSETDPTGS